MRDIKHILHWLRKICNNQVPVNLAKFSWWWLGLVSTGMIVSKACSLPAVMNAANTYTQKANLYSGNKYTSHRSQEIALTIIFQFILGQAVPKGLHIRLNMETGQREAKLMEGDGGLKFWSQEGKQGRQSNLTKLSFLKSKDSFSGCRRLLNFTILKLYRSCVLQVSKCRNIVKVYTNKILYTGKYSGPLPPFCSCPFHPCCQCEFMTGQFQNNFWITVLIRKSIITQLCVGKFKTGQNCLQV